MKAASPAAMVMMIEPTSALQKPSTWKPRSKRSASQAVNSSIPALIIITIVGWGVRVALPGD